MPNWAEQVTAIATAVSALGLLPSTPYPVPGHTAAARRPLRAWRRRRPGGHRLAAAWRKLTACCGKRPAVSASHIEYVIVSAMRCRVCVREDGRSAAESGFSSVAAVCQ